MKEIKEQRLTESIYASYWKEVGSGYAVFIIDRYRRNDPFFVAYKHYESIASCKRFVSTWIKKYKENNVNG